MDDNDIIFYRLYAKAYFERDANILLDYLSPILTYSRQSPKKHIFEKHSFVKYLNERFEEQKKTSGKFIGIIKLVNDTNGKIYLYLSAQSNEILISISIQNKHIMNIDVEKIEERKLYDREVLFYNNDFDTLKKIKYTDEGYIFIEPYHNPSEIMDFIIKTEYKREYCLAYSLEDDFVINLMSAGFIVMTGIKYFKGIRQVVVLPTQHQKRSVLQTDNIHIKKTIKKYLNKYTLKYDNDFDIIINKCREKHSSVWMIKSLVDVIKRIRDIKTSDVMPISFGVYDDGVLKAGEFGILSKNIYTSYSGYHDENNAGTAQMILTAKYLRSKGFFYWDLGIPMSYKCNLGAENINLSMFLDIFHGNNLK